MKIQYIKNREGDIIDFDRVRIHIAIGKAYDALCVVEKDDIDDIVDQVCHYLEHLQDQLDEKDIVGVEDIQDVVEKTLMEYDRYDIAKQYILYRQEHQKIRQQEHEKQIEKLEHNQLFVIKRDGSKQLFDRNKIQNTYECVAHDLVDVCRFEEIKTNLELYLIDGIKTSDLQQLLIKSAINLISIQNTAWQLVAGRLTTVDMYKQASKNREIDLDNIYNGESYLKLFDKYIKDGLYSKDFWQYYSQEDILKAGNHISKTQDMEYVYTTALMLKKRYLLNPNKVIMELPQEMYMSVALFLAVPESKETRLDVALKIYEYCSSQKISLPTPTLMNARTNFHQLSSCFKLSVDDDLRSIYHTIENMAQISKFGGGIGVYLGNVRSKGGYIRGVKGASGGVLPWVKVVNDTAIAVNQLGARAGAISVTLDIWHRDVLDFLDMQTETGDIRRKSFDIFPAVSIPDIFMQRVLRDDKRTLFDPKEVQDVCGWKIQDYFGDEFSVKYEELEKNEKILLRQEMSAKELFKKFMKTVVETGMPYVFWRDTVNAQNPNRHVGNVYSSQLCTEIAQNTSPSVFVKEILEDENVAIKYRTGDSVVCNLASINVAKVFDREEIDKIIPIAMRILDNVISLNFYPIKESEHTAMKYRSVGLGFLGLAEYLATHKMMYDSQSARDHVAKLFEYYSYVTLKSSCDLAKERGKYPLFDGSDWSKGILMGKDKSWFEANSDMANQRKDLIDDIQQNGVRFSYHLSPAPNTSTSLVVGTTAGLLPIYKKYFVETNGVAPSVNVAPNLNSQNMRYYKEYINMKMPDVIDMISVIQPWIDQAISFEWMINPAETSPAELFGYYIKAWQQKIKTVYYVRSMSLDVKECSSCSG